MSDSIVFQEHKHKNRKKYEKYLGGSGAGKKVM